MLSLERMVGWAESVCFFFFSFPFPRWRACRGRRSPGVWTPNSGNIGLVGFLTFTLVFSFRLFMCSRAARQYFYSRIMRIFSGMDRLLHARPGHKRDLAHVSF